MNGQHNTQAEGMVAERAPAPASRYREQMRADITHYTPADAAEVLQFRQALAGRDSVCTDAAYLPWLYHDPQRVAARQTAFWLYRKAGRLQAHQGGMRTGLKVGANEQAALWLLDLLLSPKASKRGVGGLLMQMACETADVTLSVDVPDDARKALLHNGWLDIGSVPSYVRPLDPAAVLRQHKRLGAWAGLGRVGNAALKVFGGFARTNTLSGLRMDAVPHFDERADEIWKHASPFYPVICRRDQAYLDWRWARCPSADEYQRFFFTHNHRAIGYAVLRVGEQHGLRAGLLVDFLCPPRYLDALVAQCLRVFGEQHAEIVYCLHNNPVATRTFTMLGFAHRQSERSLLLRAGNLDAEQLALVRDRRNWFITAGDGNADPPHEGRLFADDFDGTTGQ